MPDVPLLVTKVRIPPQPPHVIARQQLTSLLEREVARRRLTVVTAPAGYGKTTLLADWAQNSQTPVAWLALDESDNSVERLLRYLLAAWLEIEPGIAGSSFGLLMSGIGPQSEAVLTSFVATANTREEPVVFILDDYHVIANSAVHEALTFLLDHAPPALHVVLSLRGEPPLPLARYRARQQLFELTVADLSFSRAEAGAFLQRAVGAEVAAEDIARLHEQSEGWITGLQLAALTVRRGGRAGEQPAIKGEHRFIADYLREEVFAHLPQETQRFLLQTSILDRLCAPLCAAVTGEQASQEMLEALERDSLFLLPLDDRRHWFRYQPLFAGFLAAELRSRQPGEIATLQRRAADWLLAHELPEPAFRHAVAGEYVQCVLEIFDRYMNVKLPAGEFDMVEQWLDALPQAWLAEFPVLDIARAGMLAFTGAVGECNACLDDVEKRLAGREDREAQWQRARVTAVRCFVACMQNDLAQAEALAARALRELPESDANFRPGIYGALGDTYRQHGRWEEARASYARVQEMAKSPAVRFYGAHVSGALADMALGRGQLRTASDYWHRALAAVEAQADSPALPLPVIGWFYIRLAEILYEWNELEAARDRLERGLARAELGGDVRALIAGYTLAGRLHLAAGEVDEAAAYLEKARPLAAASGFSEQRSQFERCRLELWLAGDMVRTAGAWADEAPDNGLIGEEPAGEAIQLAVARALLARGDRPSLERAQAILEQLLEAASAAGRTGIVVAALAQQALAYWRRGDVPGAMNALARSLRLAEPEGYVRLFVDLGLPMARLLQEARARDVLPQYVARLLAACDEDALAAAGQRGDARWLAVPEPLTPREQEVLALLAAGLSNREIGERLVISPQTVKKHTSSIYGKLGVSSRLEAVARGREIGLID